MYADRRSPLDEKATIMLLFLMLLDLYRLAVIAHGDFILPYIDSCKDYKGLEYRVTPSKGATMTFAHVFFGISWVWLWMANLIPGRESESESGFYETIYEISKKSTPREERLGHIAVFNTPKEGRRYRLSNIQSERSYNADIQQQFRHAANLDSRAV